MPHSTPRGSHSRRIKQDPDSSHMPRRSRAVGSSASATSLNGTQAADSNYGSSYMAVDQAFYDRSNAPPPSERPSESEPLLKEVRHRAVTVIEDVASPEESSFFHTSFQDIGKKLKACNDTLGELQQLGVSHDVQLPELVLVGDQSAGKSSLMSGLANLELPRSEGACTRCPLHIRVSRNNDWSCRVWLRKEYKYQPPHERQINRIDVTTQDPFFPWKKLSVPSTCEFKVMHDKNEIEDVLRWAQIAILNDHKPPALFVPGSGSIAINTPIARAGEETQAKFSPNVVALEIKGPDLPDLSFYDMPGIFQNPADVRDDYLVNVVSNLSSAYIRHPSAIIICSMPMNSDAENSRTFGLIRELGASKRTIGVLTKADLIPGGNHDPWLAIMNGQTHVTGLGYFITSRPQDKDLEELRRWEESLFEDHSHELWTSEFYAFESRCGVEKLKAFLSERLGEEFAKSLPTIKQKLKAYQDRNKKCLANLPELPHNIEHEVKNSLRTFADCASRKMDKFMRQFDYLPKSFRNCLLDMKPKFTLKDKSDILVQEISDDDSDATSVVAANGTPTSKRRAMTQVRTPSKRPRMETPGSSFNAMGPPNGHVKPEEPAPGNGLPATPRAPQRQQFPAPFEAFSNVGRGFRTLRQVREEIYAKTTAGIPDLISIEVYEDLAKAAVTPWNGPMKVFLDCTMHGLQKELDDTLNQSMETLKKRFIYQEAKKYLRTFLAEHRAAAEESLVLLYQDETERLCTFNEEALKRYKDDERELLKRFRHHMRMQGSGYAPPGPMVPWESLTDEKRSQEMRRLDNEASKLGKDPFDREVDVVAYIRGYYRLAALRFADSVSQRIICRMIPNIRRQLSSYLEEKLGLYGPDAVTAYEKLMCEDEATATKRETLKGEKKKFEQALASIESLEMGAAVVASTNRADMEELSSQESGEQGSQLTMLNGVHAEEMDMV